MQRGVGLRCPGDVMSCATAAFTTQSHVRVGRWGYLSRITLDRPGTGGTTERRSAAVVADEKKCLSGIVRVRTWLAHELSSCNERGAARLASRMVTC